jgi:uncharacterized SAM-binding protein YcdF (DUF218 family)
MFIIKKLVATWFAPLPIAVLLLLFGLLLICTERKIRLAKVSLFASLFILLATSFPPLGDYQISIIEREYPAVKQLPEDTQYLVVLGCGHQSLPIEVPSSALYECGIKRVTEAMRHYYLNPQLQLIFTGYGGAEELSGAEVMREVAMSLGLPKTNAVAIPAPKDTAEEASAVAALIQSSPFALVTSANHLPRAVTLFQRKGLNPYPVPSDVRGAPNKPKDWWSYAPDSDQLDKARRAWYEYIGRLWVRIGGS